jgi:hypothetical protein
MGQIRECLFDQSYMPVEATYNALISLLSTNNESVKEIKKAQDDWLKFRDSTCDHVAENYNGNGYSSDERLSCLIESNNERVKTLTKYISDTALTKTNGSSVSSSSAEVIKIKCSDVTYGTDSYVDKMEELSKKAGLSPDGNFSRYHEDVVKALCSGDMQDVTNSIDGGFVEAKDVSAISKILGVPYTVKCELRAEISFSSQIKQLKISAFSFMPLVNSNPLIFN